MKRKELEEIIGMKGSALRLDGARGKRLDTAEMLAAHRYDGAETVFTARALEQIRARTYDIKYPNLRARDFLPVDNSIDPAIANVTYGQYTMVGAAIIISNYSQRLPRADVFRKEFSAKVRSIGVSYGWSMQEMREAAYTGVPLDQRKASAARRAFEEKIDNIACLGDTGNGLVGFFNLASAQTYTVPNGAASSPLWANKTPDEIIKDLNGIITLVVSTTKEIEHPNMLLLPTAQYQYIASTPRSSISDTTILEFFKMAHPEVRVESWWRLAGAGTSGTDRMIAYVNDPDHLQLVMPLEFTQMAPEWEGLELLTNCEGRCGGVQCYYPLSVCYGDGI